MGLSHMPRAFSWIGTLGSVGQRLAVWCPPKRVEEGMFSVTQDNMEYLGLSLTLQELLKSRHNPIVPPSSSAIAVKIISKVGGRCPMACPYRQEGRKKNLTWPWHGV